MKRHKALTYKQISEVLSAHDEDHEKAMKLRLDEFTNSFMLITHNEQPRRLRRDGPNRAPTIETGKKSFTRIGHVLDVVFTPWSIAHKFHP